MGSTGSGRFSDYSEAKKVETAGKTGGGGGGASGGDKCQQAFSCLLEEVAQCDYYIQSTTIPVVGTELSLVIAGRVFAVDSNGRKVGALPTSFNYLAACLANGISYVGVVKSSTVAPVPTVAADFVPHES